MSILPRWSATRHREVVNGVLAQFAIPVRVHPPGEDTPRDWTVEVFGGSLDAALERIHARQDRIIARFTGIGASAITKYEALFMYATQWVEWTLCSGFQDSGSAEIEDLMDCWLVVYATTERRYAS